MPLITWGPKYETGLNVIDVQHRGLVDLIYKLNDSLEEDRGADVMAGVFDDLLQYVHVHFRDEENLMKVHEYDDFPEHSRQHDIFTSQMEMYRESFQDGSKVVSADLLEYLRSWLLTHITSTDRGYISLFKEVGIK